MKKKQKQPVKKKQADSQKEWKVEKQEELLVYLLQQMSTRSRNSVKSILTRGQVSVNGHVMTKHNYMLEPEDQVIVKFGTSSGGTRMVGLSIIFEDDDVIIIDKEAGLLSMASEEEKQLTAYRQLMDHVKRQDKGNRVFIVHRLDRDTSGVMMFAKSIQVQRMLQENWKRTVRDRTYIAVVEGAVEQRKGVYTSWLKETSTMLMYSSPEDNGGQKAVTHYEVLNKNSKMSLLKIHLDTGRKNQIRVHMKELGHPIVGDKKYGATGSASIGRMGLHAHVLAFKHPIKEKLSRFESPVPKAFLKPFGGQTL